MEIQGPGGLPEIGKIVPNKPVEAPKRPAPAETTPKEDSVLISEQSKLLSKIASLPPVRQEKVDEIRAQIEKGEYLTEEKLTATIGRILGELEE